MKKKDCARQGSVGQPGEVGSLMTGRRIGTSTAPNHICDLKIPIMSLRDDGNNPTLNYIKNDKYLNGDNLKKLVKINKGRVNNVK